MIIVLIAWRNIWRNKVRSLIIMGSVVLGLLAGLFVLSLYQGILQDRVRVVIDEEVAHIQMHHPKFKDDYDARYIIERPDELISRLSAYNTISAVTTRTISQGMLMAGTGSSGLQIVGIDPESENRVSRLNTRIIEGMAFAMNKKNQALVSKRLAEKMRLKVNSKIILTFTDKESNIVSAAFRVSGIYQTDNAPRDERIAFVRQVDLNSLLSMQGQFHEVAILLNNDNAVDNTKASIGRDFPGVTIESWMELSPETKLMIDTTEQYSHIFILIIMLALSFGIINTMLMGVLERTREIGMLLAVGMNRFRIFSMILMETIFLTLTGAPIGILLTWLVVAYYHVTGLDISSIGGDAMTSFGFSTVIYPDFPMGKMMREMTIVLGAAILSSLIPAIRAIKLKPAEALQK